MKKHFWFVRVMSQFVPRRWRQDWRQEWNAELQHHGSLGRSDTFRRSLGAFWDVMAMQPRRLEEEMFQDLRYGIRMLLKNKLLTGVTILSLAVAIGANTAVFSIANTVLIKKLPVPDPNGLVIFEWFSPPRAMVAVASGRGYRDSAGKNIHTSFSAVTFDAFRSRTQSLSGLAAFQSIGDLNVAAGGFAEIATGQLVSGDYYRTLGVQSVLGRTINSDDDRPGAVPVAVLNYRYWQRRFGLDPQVLGKTLVVNAVPVTIIGVTPSQFSGTEIFESPEIFLPLSMQREIGAAPMPQFQWWLRMMGRLKPGATAGQVHAELQQAFQGSVQVSWDARPAQRESEEAGASFVMPEFQVMDGSRGDRDNPAATQVFSIMMAIVGLVLLIVAANVTNLLIARGAARRNEMVIRGVLGASRKRVLRQLLVESVLLALCGGAAGIVLAYWGKDFMSWLPGSEASVLRPELDARVLAFTAVVTIITGILFGLLPGIQTTRVDAGTALKTTSRSIAGSRSLVTRSLMVVQLAVSIVLLVGAAGFTRMLTQLQSADTGFNTENLLVFTLDPTHNRYSPPQIIDLYERIVSRTTAIPGVRGITSSRFPLLSGNSSMTTLRLPRQEPLAPGPRTNVSIHTVRYNFFETMEMPLLRGRGLSSSDRQTSPKVAVINETLARRFFANDDPIGKRIGFLPRNSPEIEVVGVVRDAKYADVGREIPPAVFLPYLQSDIGAMTFEVRTAVDPESFIPLLQNAVREIDPNLPVNIKTQVDVIRTRLFGQRIFAGFSASFGALSLILACSGLYALMSFNVTRRTNEIGIRMALGAYRADVVRLVMRETMTLVLIGLTAGAIGAFATGRALGATFVGLASGDFLSMAAATLLLAACTVLAGYLPARRASKLDPVQALRYD